LASATALVIANMIGAGVFTTSGFALADLGRPEPVLLAWLIGGGLATCGALSYGALARRLPLSGGEYTFLALTVHPLAGFLAGWISLLGGFTAPLAVAALTLQAYLGEWLGTAMRPEWVGTGALLAGGLMHGVRLRIGLALQNVAVVLKLLIIIGFIVFGCTRISPEVRVSAVVLADNVPAFAATLVWVSFAYSGWNAAVYVAGEVRDPGRNLQRSLVLATALVTVTYLGLNTVFLYSAPPQVLAGHAEVGAIAAEALGGIALRRVISLAVAAALFTSISSMIMAGSRVYARMAHDGFLPPRLAAKGEVPSMAVLLQIGLAIVAVWNGGLVELLGYVGFTLSLSAAATVAGLLRLRLREGPRGVPVPGYPWVPGVFIASTVAAAMFMALREPRVAAIGLLTVAAGLPAYWLLARAQTTPPKVTRSPNA